MDSRLLTDHAVEIARTEVKHIVKLAIARFAESRPLGVFQKYIFAGNYWDEFCWAIKEDLDIDLPTANIGPTRQDFIDAIITEHFKGVKEVLLPLCCVFAASQSIEVGFKKEAGIASLIKYIDYGLKQQAFDRNLDAILTHAGSQKARRIGGNPQGPFVSSSGIIWSFMLDRDDGHDFSVRVLDGIDRLTVGQRYDLAASIVDEFLDVIDGEQDRSVAHEVVTLLRGEIRELLIENDVVPSIIELQRQ